MTVLAQLLGDSARMRAVRDQLTRLLQHQSDAARRAPPVLILGETGSGKGLVAVTIHRAGARAGGPFVDVNCAAIPETLLEAELFGYERGAFTDAKHAKPGLFQTAHGGTIFLDEIGLLPVALQAKLLKVIEERQVRRLGSTRNEAVDAWVVAATSEDLKEAMHARRFREDLYHRLAVITLELPPLRERGGDTIALAEHFLAKACEDYGVSSKTLSPEARALLVEHAWPGNVRELANVIERAALLTDAVVITADALGLTPTRGAASRQAVSRPAIEGMMRDVERTHLAEALGASDGNITRAAARLGVPRNTLRYRLDKHGLGSDADPARRRGGRPPGHILRVERPAPPAPTSDIRWEPRRLTWLCVVLEAHDTGPLSSEVTRTLEAVVDKAQSFGGQIHEVRPSGVTITFGLDGAEGAARRCVRAAVALRALVERARREHRESPGLRLAVHTATAMVGRSGGELLIEPDDARSALEALGPLLRRGQPATILVSPSAHALIDPSFHLEPLESTPETGLAYRLESFVEPESTPGLGSGEPGLGRAAGAAEESVHRALMSLYAQLGRRGAALRQYQVCVAFLEREFHAEPGAETKALYQDILRRQGPAVEKGSPPMEAEPSPAPVPASPSIAGAPETPLVGREGELAILGQALDQALAGDGRLMVLLGEAGIGKSRLAAEIAAIAVGRGNQVMLGRCYETEQALPFAPWVDGLRRAGVADSDERLTGLAPVWRAELARLLPEVGVGASPTRLDADPRSLFEAVVQVMHHLGAERPLIAIFEDLHWADEMSLRLLAYAGRRLAGHRILCVATARDEDLALAPLLGQTLGELERDQCLVQMSLPPLSREDTMALTWRLVESGPMAAELAAIEEQVWRASEGNPFVAVETVRALRHERGSPGDGALLPRSVHDLIAQRLARLGEPSRRLVAVAAVVGRQCDFALLQRAADLPELEAARAVEELVRHRVLHQSGDGFEFTHDRIREVAHADLLAPHRLILHRRIAESLEAAGAGPHGCDVLALGTHYRAAEVWDKAARHLKGAGHAAWSRRAPGDSAACFEQALDALGRLAESRQTREEAFEIHFALARVVYGLGDFSRALRHYRAAEDLARGLGDDRRLSQVMGGMLYQLSSEGVHDEASQIGERALALARTLDDLTLQAWTGIGLGRAYFALAQYRLGIERTRWLVTMDFPDPPAWPAVLLPPVGSRTWLALCLARLGEYGEALSTAEAAVSAADRADNAQARVWAYYTLAHIHVTRGEPAPALALLERALALCGHGEQPLYYPRVLGALGSAHALEGRSDQAVEMLEHAAAESRAIRLRYGYAGLVTALGEACLGAGHVGEAGRLAAEAVALTRERGERGDEGWALHLTADVAARQEPSDVAAATAAYRQALAIAEELEMRPLAARCRLGLGALLGRAGEILVARAQLARASELFAELRMTRWQREAEVLAADVAP